MDSWNRRTHNPLLLWVVVLLIASLAAACGGGETPGAEPPAGEISAPTEEAETPAGEAEAPAAEPAAEQAQGDMAGSIRISSVAGAMHDVLVQIAERYQEANPGVTVTVEDEPEGGAFQALIAAGNQPDLVITSFGPALGQLAAQGALVELETLPGAGDLFARLEPSVVQQFSGHNYYVPIGADVTMMIYNKELFAEAGLDPDDPPTTWDEFLAAAEAIDNLPAREDGTDVYGTVFWNEALGWGGWYWNMLQPIYLNANQGECQLLNRLGTDITFDDEACNLQAFFDFVKQAQQFAPPTMERNFFSRTIGMWPQYGYSWEPNLETAAGSPMVIGEDVGIAPVPVPEEGDTPYSTYGGRAAIIMQTTPERQNRAWHLLQFMMEPEQNMFFIQELGYLPTLVELADDPYFQDPQRQPFIAILQQSLLPEQTAAAEAVASAVQGVYQQAVVEGALSAEEAVTAAVEAARQALQSLQ